MSAIPPQASIWDARRNTSAVFQPNPTALRDARAALARCREDFPALVAWIEEGAPNLTAAEHYARFGEDYDRPRRKRAS